MKEWFILGLTVFNSLMIIAVSGQITMLKEKLFGSSRRPSQAETEEWEQRLLSLRPEVVKCEQPAGTPNSSSAWKNPIGAMPPRYGSIPPKRGY